MTGGHTGAIKRYSRIKYMVDKDDPLLPRYEFLDKNSATDSGDSKQEQWIVDVEVSEEKITIRANAFKYDTKKDAISTSPYQYDSLTITRPAK